MPNPNPLPVPPVSPAPLRIIAAGSPVGCGTDGKQCGRVISAIIGESESILYSVAWWIGNERRSANNITLAELTPTSETKWLTPTPAP